MFDDDGILTLAVNAIHAARRAEILANSRDGTLSLATAEADWLWAPLVRLERELHWAPRDDFHDKLREAVYYGMEWLEGKRCSRCPMSFVAVVERELWLRFVQV